MRPKRNEIDYKYNWKIYIDIVSKFKWLCLIIIIFLLLAEAMNLVEKYFFKILIDFSTDYLGENLSSHIFAKILISIGIAYFALILVKSISRFLSNRLYTVFESKTMFEVKRKFFNHLIKLSYKFHTSNKTGAIINRIIKGGSAIERMHNTLIFTFLPMVFQAVFIIPTIFYFNKLSAIIILITGITFISFNLYINNKREESLSKLNDQEDFEKANIADLITNIESIKLFGKEEIIKKKYYEIGKNTQEITDWALKSYSVQSGINAFIQGLGALVLMYFSIKQTIAGQISIGTLTFIYTTYFTLIGHLYNFEGGIRSYYRAMADFESLFRYAKVENDIVDKTDAKELNVEKAEVEFKNITFKYNENPIFENFSLKIPKNKKVAIIGPSGAGKTSLIRLIYRLYDVESGEILIDGKNINEFKQQSLRSELSIVPQECVLFDDTIYNNIGFSRPNATKEEIMQAMKFAQLDKIVDSFPNKENTIVGERGVKLSGGEKQRVSIARAILANKKILVLDEATSSLDSETESEIQKDLHKLMQGRTSIIIAHRLSTIMSADIIVVVEKGKIVQKGSHKVLIKKKGLYKKLWNLQKGGYIE